VADSLLLIDDDPDVLRAFGDHFEKRLRLKDAAAILLTG
jgi:hypothetical protein